MWACTHLHAWTLNLPHCLHQQLMIHILVRRQKCFTARIQDVGHWVCLQSDAWRVAATVCVAIYICICTYLFIYLQKRTLSGPHFSTFLRMQCFCFIMFDRLCSYTCCDGITKKSTQIVRLPQRLPKNVQTGMKIPREKEGGKKT